MILNTCLYSDDNYKGCDMGEYNIRPHIKKHIGKKLAVTAAAILIILSSLGADIMLITRGKQLERELENSFQEDLVNVSEKMISGEYEYYRERFTNLDMIEAARYLENLAHLDYSQIRFNEESISVDIEHSDSKMLQESMDYLKERGLDVKIETLDSAEGIQHVTLEVSQSE